MEMPALAGTGAGCSGEDRAAVRAPQTGQGDDTRADGTRCRLDRRGPSWSRLLSTASWRGGALAAVLLLQGFPAISDALHVETLASPRARANPLPRAPSSPLQLRGGSSLSFGTPDGPRGGWSVGPAREQVPSSRPGGNPGANGKSISHRCYLREIAFGWELIKETIYLFLGCLQGGLPPSNRLFSSCFSVVWYKPVNFGVLKSHWELNPFDRARSLQIDQSNAG